MVTSSGFSHEFSPEVDRGKSYRVMAGRVNRDSVRNRKCWARGLKWGESPQGFWVVGAGVLDGRWQDGGDGVAGAVEAGDETLHFAFERVRGTKVERRRP